MLSVSRWYESFGQEPLETYRTTSLAAQTLTNRGAKNPRSHILIFKGPVLPSTANVATILVSPTPFTAKDLATLIGTAKRLKFDPVLTPTFAIDKRFADLTQPGGPARAARVQRRRICADR